MNESETQETQEGSNQEPPSTQNRQDSSSSQADGPSTSDSSPKVVEKPIQNTPQLVNNTNKNNFKNSIHEIEPAATSVQPASVIITPGQSEQSLFMKSSSSMTSSMSSSSQLPSPKLELTMNVTITEATTTTHKNTTSTTTTEITYCQLHNTVKSSPSLSHKSFKHRLGNLKDKLHHQTHNMHHNHNNNHHQNQHQHHHHYHHHNEKQEPTSALAILTNHPSTEGGISSSETESSDSGAEDYIHPQHQNQSSYQCSQQQQQPSSSSSLKINNTNKDHPLQFVCVEATCTESSKLCCAKCLSSGVHENHTAISLKTFESQISATSAHQAKLNLIRDSIHSRFTSLISRINQCKDSILSQFNSACAVIESHQSSRNTFEENLRVWRAIHQPEKSPMNEHLRFLTEQSELFVNTILSRTANLLPQTLLFTKELSHADVVFSRQLKTIEEELSKAEMNLSIRAKQALAVLPQFAFANPELENVHSTCVKRFEYPERVEFSQVDKAGEQKGRSLIFWHDGAYRIGYSIAGYSEGTCRMIWENGNVYEGQYRNDSKEGNGCFVKFSDNTSYIGEFHDDAKNGQGIEYYKNGTQYSGEFKSWKPHGEGTLSNMHTNQVIKTGMWKHGKFVTQNNHYHHSHTEQHEVKQQRQQHLVQATH